MTQVTQQPQPPQTSREYCNLDNSSLALFLSLWIDNFVFDVYCSISCWSCLLGNHLIRFVTSHLVFARSASCSRSWKQVWCAGTGLISFTPWRKHAPGLNTYLAKLIPGFIQEPVQEHWFTTFCVIFAWKRTHDSWNSRIIFSCLVLFRNSRIIFSCFVLFRVRLNIS